MMRMVLSVAIGTAVLTLAFVAHASFVPAILIAAGCTALADSACQILAKEPLTTPADERS